MRHLAYKNYPRVNIPGLEEIVRRFSRSPSPSYNIKFLYKGKQCSVLWEFGSEDDRDYIYDYIHNQIAPLDIIMH